MRCAGCGNPKVESVQVYRDGKEYACAACNEMLRSVMRP